VWSRKTQRLAKVAIMRCCRSLSTNLKAILGQQTLRSKQDKQGIHFVRGNLVLGGSEVTNEHVDAKKVYCKGRRSW
jgi:hypothetical protein